MSDDGPEWIRSIGDAAIECGSIVVVLPARISLVGVRHLPMELAGRTSVIAVVPPRSADARDDDARSYVEQASQRLKAAGVLLVVGFSGAGYFATALAKALSRTEIPMPGLMLLETPPPAMISAAPLHMVLNMPWQEADDYFCRWERDLLRGTPAYKRQLQQLFGQPTPDLNHVLDAAPRGLLNTPRVIARQVYETWATWVGILLQLMNETYDGRVTFVCGSSMSTMGESDRRQLSDYLAMFPSARVVTVDAAHGDLASATVLGPLVLAALDDAK